MTFLTRFQQLLEIFWRNQQVDLNILVHDRLKNPVESIGNTIKLFNYYHTFFSSNLPSMTDIGLLQIDSKGSRTTLLPTPKDYIAQIESMIPKVIRERTDESKKWLRKAISNLGKPVTNVEEFVEQNGHLVYVNENFQNVRDRVDLYGQIYNTLAEFQLKVKKEDKDNFTESVQQISQLSNIVGNVESQQEGSMETFKRTLNELIPQLNT
jgi:DNA-binding transcriptional regulator GbsR (MarR family)